MTDQEKILQFLVTSGPSLPSKVSKIIHSDILIASAHLSDLSAQGKVKISDIKVGGSPLYYLPGQEAQLENFAQSNLNPQDFRIMQHLKEKTILREKELDLLSKVALRGLKDFATPLHVTFGDKVELFWRWHLAAEEETNILVKKMLSGSSVPESETQTTPEKELQTVERVEHLISPVNFNPESPLPKSTKESREIPKEQQRNQHKEQQKTLPVIPEVKEEPTEFKESEVEVKKKAKAPKPRRKITADDFFPLIEEFCRSKKIGIEQQEILRKNAEINLLLKVPSVVGHLTYFCKAKNKSKCDEKDLSSAYMEAQIKKLPLLFLYSNELSKKALEMLETGAFENAIIKKLD